MIVAIASGKGGTGKTTVALSLALAADEPVSLLDCDVEEPNCHLFLVGEHVSREDVTLPTAVVDPDVCTACGTCGEVCQFGGIIVLPAGAYVFPNLCHACGACVRLCSLGALREQPRRIGEVTETRLGAITLITGQMDVGQTLAPPVVRAVRARGDGTPLVIVDAPPGTSCPVVAAVRGADVVALVTEPTPFGLNDLELAVETMRRLGLPFGVIVNRAGAGDARVHEYCAKESIPILMEIPQERRIAEAYSRGLPVVTACPELRPAFRTLLDRLACTRQAPCAQTFPFLRQAPRGSVTGHRQDPPDPGGEPCRAGSYLRSPGLLLRGRGSLCMRELVVLSGKGGTGKTSVLGSLAVLAGHAVLADCDVDAADLHLLLHPEKSRREPFFAGHEAIIQGDACTSCGECAPLCRSGAIQFRQGLYAVEPMLCEGCGLCVRICPARAIEFPSRFCGELIVSETRIGPMVHARLEPGGESSGKLVTLVRREARRLAAERGEEWVLVDGPPGIGCPVIASLSQATGVLMVTEPTPSGRHDLERVLELCRHFKVSASVCVNKWDLHPELTADIEELARAHQAQVLGRIPYDLTVTTAQVQGRPVVELGGPAADEITAIWARLQAIGEKSGS